MNTNKSALDHIEEWANRLGRYTVTCTNSSRKTEIDLIIADMNEFVIHADSEKK